MNKRKRGLFESRNPIMSDKAYYNAAQAQSPQTGSIVVGNTMTVQGAINKTFILSFIMLITAILGYANPSPLFMWGGAIGGLILVFILSARPHLSPTLTPFYAALEGLFVGSISAMYAAVFNGIIFQAVTLTLAVLFVMLFLIIRPSKTLNLFNPLFNILIVAIDAVLLASLLSLLLHHCQL